MQDEEDVEIIELVDKIHKTDWEARSQKFFLAFICFFFLIFAVPISLIFLIKSPDFNQELLVFGVSYQKLLFVFLLSSIITAYSLVFFFKASVNTIFYLFIICLFCSFPIIVGLKNDLTFPQIITDIPFLLKWPYFLRPVYILIEFLIPLSILAYLLLQVKVIFSRKPYNYAFFFAALYLSVASFFGFMALNKTQQPNIASFISSWIKEDNHKSFPKEPVYPVSSFETQNKRGEAKVTPDDNNSADGSDLNTQVQILSYKIDRILEVISKSEKKEEQDVKNASNKPGDAPPAESVSGKAAVPEDLDKKVYLLSGKFDKLMESLNQLQSLLPENKKTAPEKSEIVSENKMPDSQIAKETPVNTEKKLTMEDLNTRVLALSEKMDRIMEIIANMESFLPNSKKM